MVERLILVLGDQLTPDVAALAAGDRARDLVVMAEVADETGYVAHHPKKIAFILSAMRHFAQELERAGWRVAYTRLDDPDNSGSIVGELLRRASQTGATSVLATRPGEWRLIGALDEAPIPVTQLEDTRFIARHAEFDAWAEGRKELRLEYFYREMRRKTGLLMDGDAPVGGKWNFDHDNRKAAPRGATFAGPRQVAPDETTVEVLGLVADRFAGTFGALEPFWFAVTRDDAIAASEDWLRHGLPGFGDFQDAMVTGEAFLYHSVLSIYLNTGLLDPLELCKRVEAAYHAGHAPLNAAEGFIRQIIGWREYMRGIYFREGPDYVTRNALGHRRDLPDFFWGAPTKMRCVEQTVAQTHEHAYAHHIQRLMVTGNFALLAGIDPFQVHEWYLAVYADAFEWVEAPNVIGMSQFADGGIVGSKPYVSSGNYIAKMSDYCAGCLYAVKDKTGPSACPFNLLYWDFLIRHRETFVNNPRMTQMYRTWDRMAEDKRANVLADARAILERIDHKQLI